MTNLSEIQVGERQFSDLCPVEQDSILVAANILVQWILKEADNTGMLSLRIGIDKEEKVNPSNS